MINKKILIALILTICTGITYSQTFNSVGVSNSWKDNTSWDQASYPAHNTTNNSHTINIDNSHMITLTDVLSVKNGTVINVTANDTLKVVGDVTFANGAIVNVEPLGVFIIVGNVTNNNNSNTITIDGTIDITGDFSGGNGSEIMGNGSMDISGDVSTSGSGSIFGSTEDCAAPEDCSSTGDNPLPVELSGFTAQIHDGVVNITWKTLSEVNNDYFILERGSQTALLHNLTKIDGQGNSTQVVNYLMLDSDPLVGLNYYRLKQVDFDGSYKYSSIVYVYYDNSEKVECWIVLDNNLLTIGGVDDIDISIYSIDGLVMYKGKSKRVNTSSWNKGLYYMVVFDNDHKTKKVYGILK